MPGRIALAAGFVQEPDALLGIVDEGFEQAGGCDVIVLVAHVVRFTHGATTRWLSSRNSASMSDGST